MDFVAQLQGQIRDALKSGARERAGVLRLLLSAVKQDQIDNSRVVDEALFVGIVEKMIKQRRESIRQFEAGNRADLAQKEADEIAHLRRFLPEALDDSAVAQIIDEAIAATGAQSIKDMGRVMAHIKPKLVGRADMGAAGAAVKAKLSG